MDENVAEKKITGIRQIVRLKELLQKWQNVTLSTKESSSKKESNSQSSPSGIPPAISKRIKSSNLQCTDSDEDVDTSCQSPDPPRDVPKGYLAVYVGPELRRFTVPTTYLGDPLFKKLLEKVEEEFGFDHTGGLTIPCDVETFKYLLKCMETHHRVDLQPHEKNIEEAPLEEEE